ncbi:MAG: hypothetical protein KGI55_09370, partial [Gammaproteobacteria bacterium]|nr:hypothetical protein [Gammaproteobacteria bacterium]
MTNRLFAPRRIACAMALSLAAAGALAPDQARACACGCGLFDIGTASMFPTRTGAMLFVEADMMDQNQNWSGTSSAPAANNADQRIHTEFFNLGLQVQFNRQWGAEMELPYWNREFRTTAEDGSIVDFTHGAIGDIRLKALYTGLSDDLSTGLTFGVKLPNGDSSYANFDPDTEIGSGSTDLLLGAYHMGNLSEDGQWRYFAQAQWDRPLAHKASYAPGQETTATVGVYYEGWRLGEHVKIAPLAQLDGAFRGRDGGSLGVPT